MKRLRLVIIFSIFISSILAQDIHFTQWMHAPHTYAPSSIGDFEGKYRFHGNYRNQWSSVTVPFVTFAGMAESNEIDKYIKGASAAAGLIYDITGDSKFSTTHINLGAGYKIDLPNSLGQFRIGIQPSITQKKIDLAGLRFDNQYNGYSFDENLSTGENLPRLSRWYFDAALGLQYSKQIHDKLKARTSIAVYNLLSPKQSFFNTNTILLERRYGWQINAVYQLNNKIRIQPGFHFLNQGTYYAFNFGSLFQYDLSKTKYFKQAFFVGTYFRAVDSGDLILGMDYDRWRVALSYDVNYSGLVPASNYRGGIEVAIIYIIPGEIERPRYKICPDY